MENARIGLKITDRYDAMCWVKDEESLTKGMADSPIEWKLSYAEREKSSLELE